MYNPNPLSIYHYPIPELHFLREIYFYVNFEFPVYFLDQRLPLFFDFGYDDSGNFAFENTENFTMTLPQKMVIFLKRNPFFEYSLSS